VELGLGEQPSKPEKPECCPFQPPQPGTVAAEQDRLLLSRVLRVGLGNRSMKTGARSTCLTKFEFDPFPFRPSSRQRSLARRKPAQRKASPGPETATVLSAGRESWRSRETWFFVFQPRDGYASPG